MPRFYIDDIYSTNSLDDDLNEIAILKIDRTAVLGQKVSVLDIQPTDINTSRVSVEWGEGSSGVQQNWDGRVVELALDYSENNGKLNGQALERDGLYDVPTGALSVREFTCPELVAKFNGRFSGDVMYDSSPNTNDLSIGTGASISEYFPLPPSSFLGLHYDGVGNPTSIGALNQSRGDFAVAFYCVWDSSEDLIIPYQDVNVTVRFRASTPIEILFWDNGNGTGDFTAFTPNQLDANFTSSFNDNEWSEVVVSRSGEKVSLYLNGDRISGEATTGNTSDTYNGGWIGGMTHNGTVIKHPVDVANLALFNRPLYYSYISSWSEVDLNFKVAEISIPAPTPDWSDEKQTAPDPDAGMFFWSTFPYFDTYSPRWEYSSSHDLSGTFNISPTPWVAMGSDSSNPFIDGQVTPSESVWFNIDMKTSTIVSEIRMGGEYGASSVRIYTSETGVFGGEEVDCGLVTLNTGYTLSGYTVREGQTPYIPSDSFKYLTDWSPVPSPTQGRYLRIEVVERRMTSGFLVVWEFDFGIIRNSNPTLATLGDQLNMTLTNGSITAQKSTSSAVIASVFSSIFMDKDQDKGGYVEMTVVSVNGDDFKYGIAPSQSLTVDYSSERYLTQSGQKDTNSGGWSVNLDDADIPVLQDGDVVMVRWNNNYLLNPSNFSRDLKIEFGVNGVWVDSLNISPSGSQWYLFFASSGGTGQPQVTFNFGQNSFLYAPTDYDLGMYS